MQRSIAIRVVLIVSTLLLVESGAVHAGAEPAAACKDRKARAAGKAGKDLLKAFARNVKKPSVGKLATGISKAQSRFTRSFAKADDRGGCLRAGDGPDIEGDVEAFADVVLGKLSSICGNGIVTTDEECDDGNTNDGDCCAADCTFEAAGGTCPADDGNVCTDEACDGAGGCAHLPNAVPCDDGIYCNGGDICAGGACRHAGDPCAGGGECNAACNEAQQFCFDPFGTPCSGGGVCDGLGMCGDECNCCSFEGGMLSFETGIASGLCGAVRNFRCSNNPNRSCGDAADCDAGTCLDPPGICLGDFSVACTGNGTPCAGTCDEVILPNLPFDLECGGLYLGGGGVAAVLPFATADMARLLARVDDCGAGDLLQLGPTAAGDGAGSVTERTCTSGRTCSGSGNTCVLDADCPASQSCVTGCTLGPPLPLPIFGPVSACVINDIAEDVSGTATCDGGEATISLALRSNWFLTGDLFDSMNPPALPGVQPCPLCSRQCVGGADGGFPCEDDGDCAGGTCGGAATCMGGPNDGLACKPATSDPATLGDANGAFPTSLDCPPPAGTSITGGIGGLPILFALTTGTIEQNAVDVSISPGGQRVFAGFCRDNFGAGTLCFEGNTNPGCPMAFPAAVGAAVKCDTDADCADGDEYESCAQRRSGAFSREAASQIDVSGASDGQCLADPQPHAADLVSVFPIPPTFDATMDAAGDLPGPGAVTLRGQLQLLQPGP